MTTAWVPEEPGSRGVSGGKELLLAAQGLYLGIVGRESATIQEPRNYFQHLDSDPQQLLRRSKK